MKVLVVGASGQLGAAICQEFGPHSEVVDLKHRDLDITDDRRVRERVVAEAPNVIVNCAAYNLVDAAEDHPVDALNLNSFGVNALARAAAEVDAVLVHYSTDFVFDGRADRPYTETDPTNPESVYAMSKLVGEWFAVDAPRHYIFRVESLFGRGAGGPLRGSAEAIIARIKAGDEVRVFVDRTVSPTYVIDAARATRAAIERGLPSGLYHAVNSGLCSWWEFAEQAARELNREARLVPVMLHEVPLRAKRPKYCALSNAKLASLGVSMPDWRDALRRSLDAGNA
jgi:dTDP-4-dehydrorhamnose reductase